MIEQREPEIETVAVSRSSIRRAARGGSVFVGLSLIQRALPLLLLPVFAAVLSPDEYGRIAFLVALVGVVGALLSLGLEPGVMRNYVRLAGQPAERQMFVNTIGLFAILAPLVGAVAATLFFLSIPTLRALESSALVVATAFVGGALQTSITVFVGAVLRAEERLRAYTLVSIILAVGAPMLTVVLVVGMRLGVAGWFAATTVASGVALAVGVASIQHSWSRHVSSGVIRTALIFGIPLLPHALSHWALNLSDRLLLTGFVGSAEVGVYNLAYQLAAPIGLITIALRQGLMPMYAAAQDDVRLRMDLSRITTLQVHLTGLLGMGIALLSPVAMIAVFPTSYWAGVDFIPWIALGFVLFGLYLVPVDSMSLMLGRTRFIWIPTALAAVTNVVLNLVLIPVLGALAAAVNTAIAYAVLLIGITLLRRVERGIRLDYDLPRMSIGLAVALVGTAAGIALAPSPRGLEGAALRVAIVLTTTVLVLSYDLRWWRRARAQPDGNDRQMDARDQGGLIIAEANRG